MELRKCSTTKYIQDKLEETFFIFLKYLPEKQTSQKKQSKGPLHEVVYA